MWARYLNRLLCAGWLADARQSQSYIWQQKGCLDDAVQKEWTTEPNLRDKQWKNTTVFK